MKPIGNLFEKVTSFENLLLASRKAFRGKKTTTKAASFYFGLENEIIAIQKILNSGEYRPNPYGVFEIREPKVRQICSSSFRDRVVHHAICNVLEPVCEKRFIFDTYACRKFKGSHAAIQRAQSIMRRVGGGGDRILNAI